MKHRSKDRQKTPISKPSGGPVFMSPEGQKRMSLDTLALRLRPGSSHGVVMPALFVDNEWVDGRPMARDEKGNALSPVDLLTEVQTLLRHGLAVEMLPHQMRQARSQTA